MQDPKTLKTPQLIGLGICIGVSTIVASLILSTGFVKVIKFAQQTVNVTGSAQKNIRSNFIIWRSSVTRREPDRTVAYKLINQDARGVQDYLTREGLKPEEIKLLQLSTTPIYTKGPNGYDTNTVESYQITQSFEVASNDVDKIDALSKKSTELITQGLSFESYAPEYHYTKLDELKIEMLTLATQNAKLRADTITKASGNKLGFLRSAKMGVFQITPVTSTEVSDYGYNDTSALDKKVTAVVSASFGIE